jgi:hypothetical protein
VEGEEGLSTAAGPFSPAQAAVRLWILRITGVAGAALFGFFFVLTFSTPQWVERFAVDFIETHAREKVESSIERWKPVWREGVAGRVAEALDREKQAEIEQLKQQFKNGIRETWATALAEIRDLDCECREKILDLLETGTAGHLLSLEAGSERLTAFIQSSYMEVATELKRDIRIFTATNAGAFILLLLVSLLKPQAVRHLFVPGLLLVVATVVCTYGYIFEQNWLLTVIYGSYLGYAYAAYLGVVFLFLCDIVLNRGRVTTRLANGVLDTFGGAVASLTPC